MKILVIGRINRSRPTGYSLAVQSIIENLAQKEDIYFLSPDIIFQSSERNDFKIIKKPTMMVFLALIKNIKNLKKISRIAPYITPFSFSGVIELAKYFYNYTYIQIAFETLNLDVVHIHGATISFLPFYDAVIDENYQVFTYKNELIQVLVNLILNAKDAIYEKHSLNGKVCIRATKNETSIDIEVCDNGVGIPEELFDKLGEPYVSSKGKNGTGLGLYMSKIIIEKHFDGKLSVGNRDDGACFTVILPKV